MFKNVKIEAAAAAAAATLVKCRSARGCPERLKRAIFVRLLRVSMPIFDDAFSHYLFT